MSRDDHSAEDGGSILSFLTSPSGLVLIGLVAIVSLYLWVEHRAHLFAILVWLPVLACPLMHMLHRHGGHGGGGHLHKKSESK